jgi:dihydroorotate dehydrogenase
MKLWLLLPSKWAHDIMPWALSFLSPFCSDKTPEYKKFVWRGLTFLNPLSIAGGVDKTAKNLLHWQRLGVGFLEVGTITPLPQGPNPGQILDRDVKTRSLWNKMGFPNAGSQAVLERIQRQKSKLRVPLFVNVGKNRTTSNDNAAQDYIACMETLKPVADAFVINISSPNTQGLRQLLKPEHFRGFLSPILNYKNTKSISQPFLLKLSPDMLESELRDVLNISLELQIDGWILTNTTVEREHTPFFPMEGGVSGAPLAQRSKALLQLCADHLRNKKTDQLIISVGGVSSAREVEERLNMGANLVQAYSALVFEGPLFFKNCLNQLHQNP